MSVRDGKWTKVARLGLLVGSLISDELGTLWAGNPPRFPRFSPRVN
jgi:hypothetical protein